MVSVDVKPNVSFLVSLRPEDPDSGAHRAEMPQLYIQHAVGDALARDDPLCRRPAQRPSAGTGEDNSVCTVLLISERQEVGQF